MPKTYRTLSNETLEQFSRRVTGSARNVRAITRANPGIQSTVPENTALMVPNTVVATGFDIPSILGVGGDDLTLTIGGRTFTHWTSVRLTRSIDRLPTVTLTAPFEPDNPGFRETFRPFAFQDTGVYIGGRPFFTGVMLTPNPSTDGKKTSVDVGCYGTTGVLNDCTMPASAYPLEYNGQTLNVIANDLAEPFGITVVFDADPGAAFDKVSARETETVLAFLGRLAKQRNIVIGETELGELLFTQSQNTGNPVATFGASSAPSESITARFSAQQVYSHMTGIAPTTSSALGVQVTRENPHTTDILRPSTFQPGDTPNQSMTEAIDARLARMFANMVTYTVMVPTWRDQTGEVWAPNTTLNIHAPRGMIYESTELLIRSVTLVADGQERSAMLELVLAGAFAGEIPESLPWSN